MPDFEALDSCGPPPREGEALAALGNILDEARREAETLLFDARAHGVKPPRNPFDVDRERAAASALQSQYADVAELVLPFVEINYANERATFDRDAAEALAKSGTATPAAATKATKPKRSTAKGEAKVKLIAALTEHHDYDNGSCLKQEPIGVRTLAGAAGVRESTASRFFKSAFGDHKAYRAICCDTGRLVFHLKVMRGEFTPRELERQLREEQHNRGDDD